MQRIRLTRIHEYLNRPHTENGELPPPIQAIGGSSLIICQSSRDQQSWLARLCRANTSNKVLHWLAPGTATTLPGSASLSPRRRSNKLAKLVKHVQLCRSALLLKLRPKALPDADRRIPLVNEAHLSTFLLLSWSRFRCPSSSENRYHSNSLVLFGDERVRGPKQSSMVRSIHNLFTSSSHSCS